MKILYFGGQKSGKSKLAEQKALEIAKSKPYYIATYDNSFNDKEMIQRVELHKSKRKDNFITIEEIKDISKVVKEGDTYLVDCLSMWLLNNIEKDMDNLKKQIELISKIDANVVFVLNDVNSGVIPMDKISRKYIDFSGILGQKVASFCDEVYEVKLGIGIKIK